MTLGAYAGALGLGAAGFLLNQGSSAINSRRAWKYAQKAMALQDQYNRNMIKDYYSLNRQSLQSAGYNPLLALGSQAQGASYSPTMMNADSDAGQQAVDSAVSALNTESNIKLNNANSAVAKKQEDLLDEQIAHQRLINSKQAGENAFDPKIIGKDMVEGVDNNTVSAIAQGYNKLKSVAGKAGIDLPELPPLPTILNSSTNSANKSIKKRQALGTVKLYDTRFGKPVTYSKGVPRSVVNKFKNLERMK